MSVSIMEALLNADHNLTNTPPPLGQMLAKEQLHNAVELLSKGYALSEQVEPLLDKFGSVEAVPEKQ